MKSNKLSLVIIILLSAACSWVCVIVVSPFTIFGARDSFYRRGDDLFDVDLNFPLIKPYYATALPSGFPHNNNFREYVWRVDLKGGPNSKFGGSDSICCDIKIAVENDRIFINAQKPKESTSGMAETIYYWFVITPNKQEELGFEDRVEFIEYLSDNELNEPKWQEPDYLHNEFNMTGCLKWYPNCLRIPPMFRFPPSLFEAF
jgi:hypothetical protein